MFGFLTQHNRPSGKLPRYRKSESAAWAETLNPLRGLTIDKAARIYDQARLGIYADLHWLYQEIEAADPMLFTVAERRSSALLETDWTVRQVDPGRHRAFDEALAEDQAGTLNLAWADAERANLSDALEHLAEGYFRGFAHVRPILGGARRDTIEGFETLDGWNFARDIHTGQWWWNPGATAACSEDNCAPVPRGELVSVVRSRHIDYPALSIYVRAALGERKYGIFLERFGVPPCIVIMPPDIDKSEEAAYLAAAEKVAAGASGSLPSGSSVEYATEARNTDPFNAFLDRQQKLIVLMATGGILTSLSEPTGIGSGASDAHEATWRTVIRRDCRLIADPLNRVVSAAILDAAFPGRPHLAYFDFTDPQPSADNIFETAKKAKESGYLVRQADLQEKTGYSLEPVPAPAAGTGPFAPTPAPALPPDPADTLESPVVDTPAEPDDASDVSAKAQNGAQITSLVKILADAAAGQIPEQSVMPLMRASFPSVPEATLAEIAEPIRTFTPRLDDPASNKTDDAGAAQPRPDPVQAALQAIEQGADMEAALDAYDAAAAAALDPDVLAERAEAVAAELDAAARRGKEGTA